MKVLFEGRGGEKARNEREENKPTDEVQKEKRFIGQCSAVCKGQKTEKVPAPPQDVKRGGEQKTRNVRLRKEASLNNTSGIHK